MNIERRFVFRGGAAPAGGRISRPRDVILETGGASALTITGGRSIGELGKTRFGEFASLGSATTSAEGLFDDKVALRELTHQRVEEEALTTTTTVKAEVRQVVVGQRPALRVEQLRAALVAQSPRVSGEPSIRTASLKISGVDIGGHTLIVELNNELFEKYDTKGKLLTAADKTAFIREHGPSLLISRGADGKFTRRFLVQNDGTIYASVVRQLKWKGKPYPGSSIDHHVVTVPNFGKIFFGEIFISAYTRRLTMLRLQLGSPIGGFVAFDEVETNGSWYPP
jgi:hypothetical protein